jgi:hypothetical protein
MRIFISLVLFLSLCAFAGVKPEFQAFAANFLDLKDAGDDGYHSFTLRVDIAPWAFVYTGKVLAPNGDPDVLMDALAGDELYEVIAYVPAPVEGSDGKEYQAGVFDVMLYYSDGDEELQATIRDAKVQLLAPIASDSWAQNAFKDAQTSKGMGVWKDASYSSAITDASADPMDKTKVYASKRAAKKAALSAPAATTPAPAASTAKTDRRSSTSWRTAASAPASTAAPKASAPAAATTASTASSCDDPGMTPKERRRCRLAQSSSTASTTTTSTTNSSVTAPAASSCDDPGMTVKERRRCRLAQ